MGSRLSPATGDPMLTAATAVAGSPSPRAGAGESDSREVAGVLRRASAGAGWVVATTGALVLLGWVVDVDILKRGLPSLVTMKLHTAVGFVALGTGLVLLQRRPVPRRVVALLAAACAAVPLATLVEHTTGRSFGIDNPFGLDTSPSGPGTIPGRMAPATAVCFLLVATALVGRAGGCRRPSALAALMALVMATMALVGYAYGVESLYRFTYASVALNTAVSFVLACLALLVAPPEDGPGSLLTSTSAGGVMVRRMLPAAIVLPLLTGGLVALMLQRGAVVDPRLAFAAFTMAMGSSLGVITWINAVRLDRADERRADAERMAALLALGEERLRQALQAAGDAADEVARQRDFSSVLLGAMREGYLFTVDRQIREVNDQLCELLGFRRGELVGRGWPYPFWPADAIDAFNVAGDAVGAAGGANLEVDLLRRSGERVPVALSVRTVHNADGSIHGYVTTVIDLTESRRRETTLIAAAGRDPLTDLYNRRSIDEQFGRLRPGDAVVVLDLDHFKAVNDTYGHAAGDDVLVGLARCARATLRDGDWAGRLGGEEFVLVVRGAGGEASAAAVTNRLRSSWSATGPLATFSAGIAVHRSGAEPRETLAHADEAMYEAKRAGRDRTEIWTEIPARRM